MIPFRPTPRSGPLLALGATLAILVAACSGGGASGALPTLNPSAAASPSETPFVHPSVSPSASDANASAPASAAVPAGCPTSQPPALAAGQKRQVSIDTPKGTIVIAVDGSLSPIAAGNFVALAQCGYYDNVVFHRVVPGFVIQGGDGQFGREPTINSQYIGSGGPGYTIKDEPVTAKYARGVVAMARTQEPDSQGSQFFIVLDHGAEAALASANTYAIFGTVVSGMDAVDAIAKAADQEIPTNPVPMTKVTVAAP